MLADEYAELLGFLTAVKPKFPSKPDKPPPDKEKPDKEKPDKEKPDGRKRPPHRRHGESPKTKGGRTIGNPEESDESGDPMIEEQHDGSLDMVGLLAQIKKGGAGALAALAALRGSMPAGSAGSASSEGSSSAILTPLSHHMALSDPTKMRKLIEEKSDLAERLANRDADYAKLEASAKIQQKELDAAQKDLEAKKIELNDANVRISGLLEKVDGKERELVQLRETFRTADESQRMWSALFMTQANIDESRFSKFMAASSRNKPDGSSDQGKPDDGPSSAE